MGLEKGRKAPQTPTLGREHGKSKNAKPPQPKVLVNTHGGTLDGTAVIEMGRPQFYALLRHSRRGFFLAVLALPPPGQWPASGNPMPSRALAARALPTPGRRPASGNSSPSRAQAA